MQNSNDYEKQTKLKNRLMIITTFIGVWFIIIIGRLWYLQIIKYDFFQKLSLENRTRFVSEEAPRGLFFDRNGYLLVNNRPSYSIAVIPEDIKNNKQLIPKLYELLNLSQGEFKKKLKKNKNQPFYPVQLKNDISNEIIAKLEENQKNYPGVMIMIDPCRDYIRGESGAHFLGYLGKISENELKRNEYKNYNYDNIIGKSGLEKVYEKYLRGIHGTRMIEVNAMGQQLSSNVIEQSVPGDNIILTIDKNLQRIAEESMEGKTGAIVAIDPKNGAILAMVSKPCFNPNMFAVQISHEEWEELNNNPLHPLVNRVISGAYPPGSTFKIITAIAALEENIITQDYTDECHGEFNYGGITYKCWKKEGHGNLNVTEALIHSCNVFFYKLGLKTGISRIEKYAKKFGLGNLTGIDLGQEKQGLVPNPEWKKNNQRLPWYPGDNIIVGVGQGALLVTPLQMVNLISALSNGGVFYQPHLLKKIISVDNKLIYEPPKKEIAKLDISLKTIEIIKDALWKVVNRWGTGRRSRISGLNIIGKTGTAQVVAKADIYDDIKTSEIPEAIRPHAWFISCAPAQNPSIAIAILIEHGGEGGQAGAPIAKMMYEEYLKNESRDYSIDYLWHPDDIPHGKNENELKVEPFNLFNSTDINQMVKTISLEVRQVKVK